MKAKGLLVGCWLVAILSGIMLGVRHEKTYSHPYEQREAGDVILDVFGEFRTVMARYLWVKMELYFEALEGQGEVKEKQVEIMPLLRMITLLDPTITDAYDMIAYDLSRDHEKVGQALALLDEGIKRNPEGWALWFRQAFLLYEHKRYPEAQEKAAKAVSLAAEGFDTINSLRLLYWSSKKNKDHLTMRTTLNRLIALRPRDLLYSSELKALDVAEHAH